MTTFNKEVNDEKLAMLSEHYKNSVDTLKKDIKSRDKYFFVFIAIISILFVKFSDYNFFELIVIKVLSLKGDGITSHRFLSLVMWFLSLLCFIKYTQHHSSIERDYQYINELELFLNFYYCGNIFKKEGAFYKSSSSYIKKTNKILLKYVFPVCFLIVISNNFYVLFSDGANVANILESIICLILFHHVIFFSIES
ncbi:hypothetical protein [Vibrio harveyi]|uniref:hypothetical protein n=1 Tax=Vibrio harveyi TaxID=669 RepID=UPI002853FD74|nr:hypothetical protein [Vibrio harveyi]HDZ5416056.1 hypothetical protein [Vibrio harveyi]